MNTNFFEISNNKVVKF